LYCDDWSVALITSSQIPHNYFIVPINVVYMSTRHAGFQLLVQGLVAASAQKGSQGPATGFDSFVVVMSVGRFGGNGVPGSSTRFR
jgi:hypothetical protein